MRCGLREIGDDVVDGARLRRRERIGQRRDHLGAQHARRPSVPRPGWRALVRAHQRERELAGEQFVIGEPRPGRAFGQHVGGLVRAGAALCSASAKAGKPLRASQAASCHSGRSGSLRERAVGRLAHLVERSGPSVSG